MKWPSSVATRSFHARTSAYVATVTTVSSRHLWQNPSWVPLMWHSTQCFIFRFCKEISVNLHFHVETVRASTFWGIAPRLSPLLPPPPAPENFSEELPFQALRYVLSHCVTTWYLFAMENLQVSINFHKFPMFELWRHEKHRPGRGRVRCGKPDSCGAMGFGAQLFWNVETFDDTNLLKHGQCHRFEVPRAQDGIPEHCLCPRWIFDHWVFPFCLFGI